MKDDTYSPKEGVRWVLLGSILAGILILASLLLFQRQMARRVDEQLSVHLMEIGEQTSFAVQAEMQSIVDGVDGAAALLESTSLPLDEGVIPLLQSVTATGSVSRLSLALRDGPVYSSSPDFQATPASFRFLEETFRGESGISDLFVSTVTGQEVLSIYRPIYRDGAVVAGLFGTIVLSDLSGIISFSGFNGEGYFYLLQSNGNTVMCTANYNQLYQSVNFYEFLDRTAHDPSLTGTELRQVTNQRKSGFFTYGVGGQMRKVYYCPVTFKDWSVLSVVPTAVLDRYSGELYRYALTLTTQLLAVCAALFLVVALWTRANLKRLRAAHMAALGNSQKYRLALQNAKYQMFEYDPARRLLLDSTGKAGAAAANTPLEVLHLVVHGAPLTSAGRLAVEHAFSAAAEGEPELCELERTDGTWLRLSLSAVRQPDGVRLLGTVEDITQFKAQELRYASEEQYREAMQREAISGFSVDLEDGRILTSFFMGREREDRETHLTQDLTARVCRSIQPDYRAKLIQLLDLGNLHNAHARDVQAISEHFPMRLQKMESYLWVTLTIHFLTNPASGHPLAFAYIKNVNEEKTRELELEHCSEHDGLTGLLNRVAFVKKVEAALARPCETGASALLMMDLDGFKSINDTYGHQMGDQLLQAVAQELERGAGTGQLVGRLGGDEFVLFLRDAPDRTAISQSAQALRRQVALLSIDDCGSCIFTLSVGIAFVRPGDTFDTLYPRADKYLYKAKHAGKNRVCASDGEEP